MGGVPDPIFSRPNIKEKIAVWLRETKSDRFSFFFCLATRDYENSGLTKRDYGAMQAIKPYMLPTHKSWFA